MRKLRRTLLLGVWTAAGVLVTAGPAPAFYFNGWPGSGEPIRRSLIPSDNQNLPGNPPGPGTVPPGLPPGTPPGGPPIDNLPLPPLQVPPIIPTEQPPPEHIPEPATGLIGLIGLSAAVVARWRRG